MEAVSLVIWDLTSFKSEIQCWWIVGSGRIVSQYPPNFSYVEADKTVDLGSLDLTD